MPPSISLILSDPLIFPSPDFFKDVEYFKKHFLSAYVLFIFSDHFESLPLF